MTRLSRLLVFMGALSGFGVAQAQAANSCASLDQLRIDGVEIVKAAIVPAGSTVPSPYAGGPSIGLLPAHCRVDGVINRRKGADGEEFGIAFALALPEAVAWNGDLMMQGGGGGDGVVAYPVGGPSPATSPLLPADSPL